MNSSMRTLTKRNKDKNVREEKFKMAIGSGAPFCFLFQNNVPARSRSLNPGVARTTRNSLCLFKLCDLAVR